MNATATSFVRPGLHKISRVFATSRADAWLVAVFFVHATLLAAVLVLDSRSVLGCVGAAIAVAFGTVYGSNTVSHWHLHRPLFTSRGANRLLTLALTALLLLPQTAWRQRHLWHHAGEPRRRASIRFTPALVVEVGVVVVVVALLLTLRPHALFAIVLPGIGFGLLMCSMQGHYEHSGDPNLSKSGVSHYGWLYNALWFNDGFHAEHHRAPARHWTELPALRRDPPCTSVRAPLLRWSDLPEGWLRGTILSALERGVLGAPRILSWLVSCHTRALAAVLTEGGARLPRAARVLVVGGGLFPRTVLALRQIAPKADVTVIDASADSLRVAARFLRARRLEVPRMVHAAFDPAVHVGFDLVVFPLAFVGASTLLADARARNHAVAAHAWLTMQPLGRLRSRTVSVLLFKKVCLL